MKRSLAALNTLKSATISARAVRVALGAQGLPLSRLARRNSR